MVNYLSRVKWKKLKTQQSQFRYQNAFPYTIWEKEKKRRVLEHYVYK